MTQEQPLRVVAAYDRSQSKYSLIAHNQTPEEAQIHLEQWTRELQPGSLLFVLDQVRRHQTEDIQQCRACRETVTRSRLFEPQPKFVRRTQ